MLAGLETAARAVGVAMGPRGRYVVVERDYGPPVLRDGVGIVRVINLEDRHQQIGVHLARGVAVQCSDQVGDGTAAAVLLLHALVSEGMKAMAAGLDPVDFLKGMRSATAAALAHIDVLAQTDIDAKTMAQIATVAANGDAEIGTIVARAVEKAGDSGLLTVRVGNGVQTSITHATGYGFESKVVSDRLVVASRNGVRELEDVFVLVVDGEIATFEAITPLLESILSENQPLVIVAESIGALALAGLIENKRSAIIDCVAVRSTLSGDRRTDVLKDLALFTGGQLVGGGAGPILRNAGREVLGTAARAVFAQTSTLFVSGGGDSAAIEAESRSLALAADRAKPGYDQDHLRKRRARLVGTSVTIEIGGVTELEAKERRDRTDNSTRTVKAALAGGYVAGGGLVFLAAVPAARASCNGGVAYDAGIAAVCRALETPALRILANAGLEGRALVARLAGSYPRGIELCSGVETDLLAAGILDPAVVAKAALESAASAAEALIRTEVVILKN
jgi:chaperonin GroEL